MSLVEGFARLIEVLGGVLRTRVVDAAGDSAMDETNDAVRVNVVAGGAGDGSILDGVTTTIKSTVFDYTNSNPVAVRLTDTNGDFVSAGAGTQYTEDAVAAADPIGTALIMVRDDTPLAGSLTTLEGDNVAARGTNSGELYVKHVDSIPVTDNAGSLTVDVGTALPAGANNIGDVDILTIAAGDNNIGNVDVVTLPASTNTLEVVGDVAHDAAAAGNPVLVCGVAQASDDTAPPNRVSTESDATRLATDFDGTQYAHPHGPQIWSYHENSSSALTDATVHAAPGAGLSLYVTDIVCSTGAATAMNIFLEESTTTTILGPYYLEAVAGRGIALHFQTPKKITANTALTVTTSAAIAHSVDVTGYTAQG